MTTFLDDLFKDEGLLSTQFKGFEARLGQQAMAQSILTSFEQEGIALIEAGTGIGKSLSYLAPSIYWALKHQEKIVISTHTIALQEQLIHKDIPLLAQILDIEIQATLVKGMGNYLCLRNLHEQPLMLLGEKEELHQIEHHLKKNPEGCKSSFSFPIAKETWEKVGADPDTCSKTKCSHYKECYFFKAREKAAESQVLVVNHSLLLADLKQKKDALEKTALPKFSRLIIDEAHQLEKVALESFALCLNEVELIKLLHRLYSETHPEKSRLRLIQEACSTLSPTLLHEVSSAIPTQKKEALVLTTLAFGTLQPIPPLGSSKCRITDKTLETQSWKDVEIAFFHLKDALSHLSTSLYMVIDALEEASSVETHLVELKAITKRLDTAIETLAIFFGSPKVRWIELGRASKLYSSDLNVGPLLKEHLFTRLKTTVLCSATLTSNRSFHFLKERLGLETLPTDEKIYDSPFDYEKRTLLLIPTDLPDPKNPHFLKTCEEIIDGALLASKARAFLLFTSYESLETCFHHFSLKKHPYTLLAQGKMPRHHLLKQFKQTPNAVLFGTSSFWEGVDVPGDALGLVIIVKLPFQVPTEPLYEAYSEELLAQGKNPFLDYSIPQAIIRFKQGFGRLMRTKTDRGCVLSLDTRLITKPYGSLFLNSLPPCKTLFAPQKEVLQAMHNFYNQRF